MRKLVQSHPITAFIIVTFFYSWTLWALMILSNRGVLPFTFPTNFTGSFGPAVGAIVVALLIGGRSGAATLLRPLRWWRASAWIYLYALFLIVLLYLLTIGAASVMKPEVLQPGALPDPVELVLYFFIVAVVGGPLGEEIGWRGFLQPQLQKKHSPVFSTIAIWVIWLVWHVPLFWLEGAAQEGGSIATFAVSVLCMSFLFTWLYLQTNGSLFFAILFHTSINFVSAVVVPAVLPLAEKDEVFGYMFSGFLLAATALFVATSYRRFTNHHALFSR